MEKNNKKFLFLIIAVTVVIIPFFLGCFISSPIFKNFVGGINWIGFWGSYLGSVVSGLITLFVLFKTLESNKEDLEKTFIENKKMQQRQEKIDYCEKIIRLSSSYVNDVVDELIGAKNFFDQRTEETYNKYNLYRGKSVRINNELVLTICVKDNDDDYCRYKKYDDLCLEVTNKTGEIENLLNKLHKKIFQSNEIDIEQDLLMIAEIWERNQDFFNRFQDDFKDAAEEFVRKNLE